MEDDVDIARHNIELNLQRRDYLHQKLRRTLAKVDDRHLEASETIEQINRTLTLVKNILPEDLLRQPTEDDQRLAQMIHPASSVAVFEELFPQGHTGGYNWPVRLECEAETRSRRGRGVRQTTYSESIGTLTDVANDTTIADARERYGPDIDSLLREADQDVWGSALADRDRMARIESRMGQLFPDLPDQEDANDLPGDDFDAKTYTSCHASHHQAEIDTSAAARSFSRLAAVLRTAVGLRRAGARGRLLRARVMSVSAQRRELFQHSGAERDELERALAVQEHRLVVDKLSKELARKHQLAVVWAFVGRASPLTTKDHLPPTMDDEAVINIKTERCRHLEKVDKAQKAAQAKLQRAASGKRGRNGPRSVAAEARRASNAAMLQLGIPLSEAGSVNIEAIRSGADSGRHAPDRRLSILNAAGTDYTSTISDPFRRKSVKEMQRLVTPRSRSASLAHTSRWASVSDDTLDLTSETSSDGTASPRVQSRPTSGLRRTHTLTMEMELDADPDAWQIDDSDDE